MGDKEKDLKKGRGGSHIPLSKKTPYLSPQSHKERKESSPAGEERRA